MGFRLEQVFPAMDDNDGYGVIAQFPDLPDHPDFSGDSGPPYLNHTRLYPLLQEWWAMRDDGSTHRLLQQDEYTNFHNAVDDEADIRPYKFWTDGHQTANAGVFLMGGEFSVKYDIDTGITNSSDLIGLRVRNQLYAADSDGTALEMEGVQAYVGIRSGAHSPTIADLTAFKAVVDYQAGTIQDLYLFKGLNFNVGGTVDRMWGVYIRDAMATENIGFFSVAGTKDIWEFTESDIIVAPAVNFPVSGKNHHVTSDNNYNIDGFAAVGQNRDGDEHHLFNGNSSFNFTVLGYNGSGTGTSAGTHDKVFTTTGADLAWNAGQMLHLLYNALIFSGAGGWIAWVT